MTRPVKIISSRSVYQNQYVNVVVDTLEKNGKQWEQVYFTKPEKDGVGIIPLAENGIYLLHQYRHASGDYFWQIPLGQIDKGSTALETAKIELAEEAGMTSDKLTKIGSVNAEPGMSPQIMHMFVAESLHQGEQHLSETEEGSQLKFFSFEEIEKMIASGEITCGFTLSALLLLKNNFFAKKSQ